jgi:hypothetical protein
MIEEPRSEIKPVWLVAGGAALTIIAGCAILSVCAAAAFLWFSTPRSNNTGRPTSVAIQPETTLTPTLRNTPPFTITRRADNVPTLLPLPATPGALPTSRSSSSQPQPNTAPDQAVRAYYDLVSQKRFNETWPMLTDDFKQKFNCCAPNYNYTGYVDWWNSVSRVEVGNVRAVSQNGDQAVVYAELYYVMNNGERSSMDDSPYIVLVYEDGLGWRFDDKRTTP